MKFAHTPFGGCIHAEEDNGVFDSSSRELTDLCCQQPTVKCTTLHTPQTSQPPLQNVGVDEKTPTFSTFVLCVRKVSLYYFPRPENRIRIM